MKGEEYETILAVESRGNGWIGSAPTTFSLETGQLMEVEPLPDGTRIRLRFLGKYAGRSQGVKVGISFTDPLKLFKKLDQMVSTELVLDTMPLSLLAPEVQRRLKVIGYGERSTGYAGQGQELYKLDEFNPGYTKDIVWRRVAKSADEALVARVREANVTDVLRIGVVRFAERGDEDRAAWTDKLCEALGEVGREILETGASPILLYHHGPREDGTSEEERSRGMTRIEAEDIDELAEAVMSCSVASDSRDVEAVVADSDLVVTGSPRARGREDGDGHRPEASRAPPREGLSSTSLRWEVSDLDGEGGPPPADQEDPREVVEDEQQDAPGVRRRGRGIALLPLRALGRPVPAAPGPVHLQPRRARHHHHSGAKARRSRGLLPREAGQSRRAAHAGIL